MREALLKKKEENKKFREEIRLKRASASGKPSRFASQFESPGTKKVKSEPSQPSQPGLSDSMRVTDSSPPRSRLAAAALDGVCSR